MAGLQDVFNQLSQLLESHGPGMELRGEQIGSQAKVKKPGYHLYGKEAVSVFGRKPEQIYLAGTILQKNFVSLYFMPLYCHPEHFQDMDPRLKKLMKGKACFNIKALDPEVIELIDQTISRGKNLFQQDGWI
ncbi:MAG: hypothetical protein O2909_04185 [Chloroflexi bacterium]|nr:hypothetical protein [Chloroflexota bacterium]MDA1218620.1 hypothetical protein [Chloroflexota bacterium]